MRLSGVRLPLSAPDFDGQFGSSVEERHPKAKADEGSGPRFEPWLNLTPSIANNSLALAGGAFCLAVPAMECADALPQRQTLPDHRETDRPPGMEPDQGTAQV